jgi:type IV pilus assembly protein PilQ
MELREGAPSTYLDIVVDGPLVWTSYRDADGNLVIELPNSVPQAGVGSLDQGEGIVLAVKVQREDIADRPLTRLTVVTRGEAEHSLDAQGERLRLELMPVARDRMADQPTETGPSEGRSIDAAETSYEPLPVEETRLTEVSTAPGSAPSASPSPAPVSTPGASASSGPPATVLADVSVLSKNGGAEIKVSGDGTFRYSTFQLSNPERYVIDLDGVVNASPRSVVVVEGGGLERVRVAQFKGFPDPVSRVVFDLTEGGVPRIEETADGLVVRFGSAAAHSAPSSAEPEAEMAAIEPSESAPAATETVATADAAPPMPTAVESAPPMEPADPAESLDSAAVADATGGESFAETTDATEMAAMDLAEEEAEQPSPQEDQVAMIIEDATPEAAPDLEGTETESPQMADVEESAGEGIPAASEVVAEVPPPRVEPTFTEPVYREPPVEEAPLSDIAMFEAAEVQYDAPTEQQEGLTTTIGTEVVGSGGQVWSGDPISLSLQDADIKDVLRSFSTITGLNVVVHPGVRGTVTVELNDVPWDQALDLILRINNLDYVLEGNIMRIASTDQLRQEAEERRALAAAQAQEIPLQTVIRAISYAQASQIATLLNTTSGGSGRSATRILSPRGSVSVDARTNKLIIKDLPSNMNAVLAVIANLDTAEPQVLIEARIVETTKQFSRSLGIEWSFNGVSDPQFGNTTGLAFPHQGTASGGVQLLTGGQNAFLDITMGNVLNTFNLDLSLQAAETEGLVSILSAPRIATLNNERASIQSGLQIPIQTVSNNTVSVQFVNATLQLQVTPQVTAEGTVMMDIDIAKRAPQPALAVAGSTNAPISTKQARTRVIVRDGGTTVIGGIYEVTNDRGEDRVPGLANVPILGHLFRNKRRNQNNEELLIFLTPRVIQL